MSRGTWWLLGTTQDGDEVAVKANDLDEANAVRRQGKLRTPGLGLWTVTAVEWRETIDDDRSVA